MSLFQMEKNDIGYDIGPKTIELFKKELESSKMVLWNGPLGKYEEEAYENGTKEILKYTYGKKYGKITNHIRF